MSDPIPVYTSRSQYMSGLDCQHMSALNYHSNGLGGELASWDGIGITPKKEPSYYQLGTLLHNALEALCLGVDFQQIQQDIWKFEGMSEELDFGHSGEIEPHIGVREGATFIEASCVAFQEVILPKLLAEYEVLHVEHEISLNLNPLPCAHCPKEFESECQYCDDTGERPLIWQSKPDVILKRKRDGCLFVMDLKSTGRKQSGADLERQFQHSILVQAQLAALEEQFGQPATAFIYMGILKGWRQRTPDKHLGYRRQVSPFIYAYCSPEVPDGLSKPVTSHDKWRTGPPKLLADLPHTTIRDYVLALPREVKEAQFLTTAAPIGFDPLMAARWREEVWKEELRFLDPQPPFPSNSNNCFRYGVNRACVFLSCCYSENVKNAPLDSGLYVPRVPHHEIPKET